METLNIGSALVENLPNIHEEIKAEALNKLAPVAATEFYKTSMKKLEEVS
jgi:hypothetical protein